MTSIIWTSALKPAAPALDAAVPLSAITMIASVSAQARNPITHHMQWLQEQNLVASDFAGIQMSRSDSLRRKCARALDCGISRTFDTDSEGLQALVRFIGIAMVSRTSLEVHHAPPDAHQASTT